MSRSRCSFLSVRSRVALLAAISTVVGLAVHADDERVAAANISSELYESAEKARAEGDVAQAVELYTRAGAHGVGPGSADALAALARMHEFGWGGGALSAARRSVDVYTSTSVGSEESSSAWSVLASLWQRIGAVARPIAGGLWPVLEAAVHALGVTDTAAWALILSLAPPPLQRVLPGSAGAGAPAAVVVQVRACVTATHARMACVTLSSLPPHHRT